MAKMFRSFLFATLLFVCSNCALGFTCHRLAVRNKTSSKRWFAPKRRTMTMYLPPNTPTSQTAPMVGQKILAEQRALRRNNNDMNRRTSPATPLSNSVLASSDTLPRFHTAHGLLSPETIQRLDEMIPSHERSEVVALFLDRYHHHGPMSCLDFLADPNVLPHLTEAMRDIV